MPTAKIRTRRNGERAIVRSERRVEFPRYNNPRKTTYSAKLVCSLFSHIENPLCHPLPAAPPQSRLKPICNVPPKILIRDGRVSKMSRIEERANATARVQGPGPKSGDGREMKVDSASDRSIREVKSI